MNKKHIALNTQIMILGIVLFPIFLGISIVGAKEKNMEMCILSAIITLVIIFVFLISPLCFVFSDEGVEIIYHFGQRENIKWNEIRSITQRGSWVGGGMPCYEIAYPCREKRWFFVCGSINKMPKTTRLIKKYYKKEID
jgi:hypothetical protein